MRRLTIIPGLLFGLIFAGGGFFFLSETSLPTWQSWSEMKNWRPGYAKLLSVTGSENQNTANYRYEYGGSTYQSSRVYVAEFSDNIGSYHADMLQRLRPYQTSGQPLPIWINPLAPQESVIDRDMRWGLFALMTGFCSVFILIGLAVVYASIRSSGKPTTSNRPSLLDLRKEWKEKQKDPDFTHSFLEFSQYRSEEWQTENNPPTDFKEIDWQSHKGWETARIASNATKGVWFFWIFALIWNAVSIPFIYIIPDELQKDNYATMIALLFPLVGLFLIYKAVASTLEYRHFGKVLFEMDPYPGAIGGNVGGRIQVSRLPYQQAIEAQEIWIRLECVYSYVSGSGKNRSRRESIKWAEQGKPQIDSQGQGISLQFRFDVPENLPNADVEHAKAYHLWRLTVKADVSGVDLNRNYNIPAFNTGETSRFIRHDISAQSTALKAQESLAAKSAIASGNFDIEGLSRAMQLQQQGSEISLKFPMLRNKALTLFAAIFAGGFGFATFQMADMASEGGLFGIFIAIFGLPFFLVALLAGLATIYLPLNNLRVVIDTTGVSILRRLLFIPIFRRHLSRNDISHLSLKKSGSTGQGVKKIKHFKIKVHDKNGRSATLAEDIDGEDVATHFCDYLAQRLNVSVK